MPELAVAYQDIIVFAVVIFLIAVFAFALSVWDGIHSLRQYTKHTREMMRDQASGRPLPSGWGEDDA